MICSYLCFKAKSVECNGLYSDYLSVKKFHCTMGNEEKHFIWRQFLSKLFLSFSLVLCWICMTLSCVSCTWGVCALQHPCPAGTPWAGLTAGTRPHPGGLPVPLRGGRHEVSMPWNGYRGFCTDVVRPFGPYSC